MLVERVWGGGWPRHFEVPRLTTTCEALSSRAPALTAQGASSCRRITDQASGSRSFTEISFGLTYRDSRCSVGAGEWLASAGGR